MKLSDNTEMLRIELVRIKWGAHSLIHSAALGLVIRELVKKLIKWKRKTYDCRNTFTEFDRQSSQPHTCVHGELSGFGCIGSGRRTSHREITRLRASFNFAIKLKQFSGTYRV